MCMEPWGPESMYGTLGPLSLCMEPWYKKETKAPCEEGDLFICRPDEKETGPVLYIVAT